MTFGSVPRRRLQPALRASADASAPLGQPGSGLPRPGRAAGGPRAREAGGREGLHFPTPFSTLGACLVGARLLETSLCFLLSIPHGPGSPGVRAPREKRGPPAMPTPARSQPPLPKPGRRGAAVVPGQRRVQRARVPSSSPWVRGAGFAQVCWAMPFPEPDSRAGREGSVIDRLNYRLISYLRPRALIGCSLTSSNPAAPRCAREGGGCGWRCASDKPESHFQSQVDFVPTIGGVAPPLHGRGQTSSSAPLLMEPHLLGLLLGLLLCGTRVLAGYPIWW